MLRSTGYFVVLLFVGGCSSTLGPDSSVRIPQQASASGSAVNLYWPCLIKVPSLDVYRVEIDGKDVGEMPRCGYRRFQVAEGSHAVRLRSPLMLDVSGALGFQGAEYSVPAGKPIYIRLTYFQYVQYQQVPADQGIREITDMAKS